MAPRSCYLLFGIILLAQYAIASYIPVQYDEAQEKPLEIMVDIVNSYGLKVLHEHNYLNENNIAFSPYGLAGILIALYEGVNGDSAFEIRRSLALPWDRGLIRVGFRDVHRLMKSYFVPEEGFLAGLSFNRQNIKLRTEYKNVLNFYGFDFEMLEMGLSSMTPPSNETTLMVNETTVPTVMMTDTTPIVLSREPTTQVQVTESETTTVTEAATVAAATITTTQAATTITASQTIATTTEATATTTTTTQATTTTTQGTTTTTQPTTTTTQGSVDITTTSTLAAESRDTESQTTSQTTTTQMDVESVTAAALTSQLNEETSTLTTTTATPERETTESTTVTTTPNTQETSSPAPETNTNEIDESTTQTVTEATNSNTQETSSSAPESNTNEIDESITQPVTEATNSNTQETSSSASEANTSEIDESTEPTTPVVPERLLSTEVVTLKITILPDDNDLPEDIRVSTNGKYEVLSHLKGRTERVPLITVVKKHNKRLAPILEHSLRLDQLHFRNSYYDFPNPSSDYENRHLKGVFLCPGNRAESVEYMKYSSYLYFVYMPYLRCLVLKLPLDNDRYYMMVFLPEHEHGLDRLIKNMNDEKTNLKTVHDSMEKVYVNAWVPSFMVKGIISLTSDLQRLGIRSVFQPRQRDFAPMTSNGDIYVRNVDQSITITIKKYKEMPEVSRRYGENAPWTVQFAATYPFLYFIMDSDVHVALMAGKIVDPLNSRIL